MAILRIARVIRAPSRSRFLTFIREEIAAAGAAREDTTLAGVRRQESGVRRQASGVRRQASGVKREERPD